MFPWTISLAAWSRRSEFSVLVAAMQSVAERAYIASAWSSESWMEASGAGVYDSACSTSLCRLSQADCNPFTSSLLAAFEMAVSSAPREE